MLFTGTVAASALEFMDVENQRLLFHGKDCTPTALQNNLAFF
jgi:hypothetical protein